MFSFDGRVDRFRILGIESLGLDPADPVALATGLTFTGEGPFTVTMTPITESAPEPGTLALISIALAGVGLGGKARRERVG